MSGGISIHVVDVASGSVAEGLEVRLVRLEGEACELICAGPVSASGQLEELAQLVDRCRPGVYEVRLKVADFYRKRGMQLPELPFLDEVVYRFGTADAKQHYHLPFKLTAWGLSCFRGGA
ncbi:5-hydroxyisourate hydrolase [Pseudomonas taiwanensis]|uniref:hydroxyisourate hydrolase n=1 Tax=Pseudomonas taiwanensis TaxID=470150 RepID=UPI0015BCF5B8|nr:5-hydroxyisourate hydrolase [Pseudomonas taiwanensis]